MQKPFVLFTAALKIVTFSLVLSTVMISFSTANASEANTELVFKSVRSQLWHIGPATQAYKANGSEKKIMMSEELQIAIDKELSLHKR